MYHVKNGLVSPSDMYSLPVFPTQLAASFVCLVVSGICIWLFVRKKLKGKILGLYFVLYGALRFILQWYRPDYDKNNVVSGWNIGHSICLLMLFVGLLILFSQNPEKKLFWAKNLSNKD
jgi:prolipoprotein diacylglyceryltransferase